MGNHRKSELRVCVTGYSGFLGHHLLGFLSSVSSAKIFALGHENRPVCGLPERVSVVNGDLLDFPSVDRFVQEESIVINLAYLSRCSEMENLQAINNLIEACVQKKARCLIHVSTATVVGAAKDGLVDETTICHPISEYQRIKLRIEHELLVRSSHRCHCVILRPTAIVGIGGKNLQKHADELLNESHGKICLRRAIFGRRRFNLVCVENVAAAIWFIACCAQDITSGSVFIVSDDDDMKNNYLDVSCMLAERLGVAGGMLLPVCVPRWMLKYVLNLFGKTDQLYSCEKLAAIGFKKPYELERGIKSFADFYLRTRQGQGVCIY